MIFDHVKPDRDHVVQSSWSGGPSYDYDEWITIGSSQFTFLGLWFTGLGTDRSALTEKFGLYKYVRILQHEQPISAAQCVYEGKRYGLLTYLLPSGDDFLAKDLKGPVQVQLWSDAMSGLLARARIVPAPSQAGGVSSEFEQVFVGYGDDIRVDPPPSELTINK